MVVLDGTDRCQRWSTGKTGAAAARGETDRSPRPGSERDQGTSSTTEPTTGSVARPWATQPDLVVTLAHGHVPLTWGWTSAP